MAKLDTPILNKLAQVNDGRSALSGEHSGAGYFGGLGEAPVVSQQPSHKIFDRMPERDTKNAYAFKTGPGKYKLIAKSEVDGK